MKIIQAMKQIVDLKAKAEDLRDKVARHCSDLSIETPVYSDQAEQVANWIQSHSDVLKEILRLRLAIQRTNLATMVTIELDGKFVEKTLAEWTHRRRDLAKLEETIWRNLTDRGLKEQNISTIKDGPITEVRIRRYFDPKVRDARIDAFRKEPSIIDGHLEVVNATTDLIE